MKQIKKSWQLSVYQACLAETNETTNIFYRKNIIKNNLSNIINTTDSTAADPSQSLSKNLQDLRNFGFIEFTSRGKYKLLKKDIDLAFLNNKKMSRGEKLVCGILDELDIPYKREATHSDLKYKGFLRFDFEINHNNRKFVIEVDGVQHDRPVDYFGGVEAFVIRKKCDKIKDDYCKNTNRTMIRIKSIELNYHNIKHKLTRIFNADS